MVVDFRTFLITITNTEYIKDPYKCIRENNYVYWTELYQSVVLESIKHEFKQRVNN